MLSPNTLSEFIRNCDNSNIAVLTALAPNPFGYGRIVRDKNNSIVAIIEEKDATEDQKLITEINSGIYYVDAKILFSLLDEVKSNNAQNEFYLTDIITHGISKQLKVVANTQAPFTEILGVNTKEQLQDIEFF